MLFVAPAAGMAAKDFNRELWRLRIASQAAVHQDPSREDFYSCSRHSGIVVYKGQLTPVQVCGHLLDLHPSP